jgi:hypothetical protein
MWVNNGAYIELQRFDASDCILTFDGTNYLGAYDCLLRSCTVTASGWGFNYVNIFGESSGSTVLDTGGYAVNAMTAFGLPANPTTLSGDNSNVFYGFGTDTLVD